MKPDDFIGQIKQIILQEMHHPQFGVGDLAEKMAMSRSSLLRHLKKHNEHSVNSFIKKVRLNKAKELLAIGTLNVSEISHEVGFSSPSYFIKCFREEFGYSPGNFIDTEVNDPIPVAQSQYLKTFIIVIIILLILISSAIIWTNWSQPAPLESNKKRSIAVLPFINESQDSTQQYLVNGMMESILTNLQRIGELRVVSRTSVEQYRMTEKTIPQIADELSVDYLVEGSLQRHNNEILLTVQLIAGPQDEHLWSEQYRRDIADIFQVQSEVATEIARAIQVTVSPEVGKQIKHKPTQDPEAYRHFLKGMEWTRLESDPGLDSAILEFQYAIRLDENFAKAYAYLAICYYYKDIFKKDKRFTNEMSKYSDRAMLIDGELPESLLSKGLYYMHIKDYQEAIKFLELGLNYYPNSAWIHNFLAEIYTTYVPNTEKYLIHALSARNLEMGRNDSAALSFSHLHLANAFAQAGMIQKAKEHLYQSLSFNSENIYTQVLEVYVNQAQQLDLDLARNQLEMILQKDTTRIHVVEELGKICYAKGDLHDAAAYYDAIIKIRDLYGLDIYHEEDITMAYIFRAEGDTSKAQKLLESFEVFLEKDTTVYKPLHESVVALYQKDLNVAIEKFKEFSEEDNYMYWVLLFIENDPLFEDLMKLPDSQLTLDKMRSRFETNKQRRIELLKQLNLW